MFSDTLPARLFRSFLVVAMMVALAATFLSMAQAFVPGYAPWWFLPGAVLVTAEALASSRLRERLELRGQERLFFHLTELGLLVLSLRLLTLSRLSLAEVRAVLADWAWYPSTVFDPEFVVLLVLLVLLWQAALGIGDDLALLELRRSDLDAQGRPFHDGWPRGDPRSAQARLVRGFFWGGALLLVFAALPRLEPLGGRRVGPLPPAMLAAAVGYFVGGLVLLSQAHLALLQFDWAIQGLSVDERVAPRWRRLSLVAIGLVAVAVAFVPTYYAGGLLEFLQVAVVLTSFVISALTLLLITLITLPFALLLALVRGTTPLPPAPLLAPPLQAAVPSGGRAAWLEILRMVLVWSLLFGLAGHILREYLAARGLWVEDLRRLRVVGGLVSWLMALVAWVRGRRIVVRAALAGVARAVAARRRTAEGAARRWPRLRLGRLSPREQIRYFYLSSLRRAAQAGYPRRPAQTPAEYSSEILPELGERAAEWEALTEAFIRARYAPGAIAPAEARAARDAWQRVQRALRALRAARR